MNFSWNSTFDLDFVVCGYVQVACCFAYFLQLPVFLSVLFLGFRQCRKERGRSSTATHSDVFTFNLATMEMIGVSSSAIFLVHFYSSFDLSDLVQDLAYAVGLGQTFLHILICVERYLAVVHPIFYLRLKKNGELIRNSSIAVVWLLCCGMGVVYFYKRPAFVWVLFVAGVLSLVSIGILCARVLFVLIRPGPGKRGGDRKHVDQSKLRAFYTVAAITATLTLKFALMFVLYMAIWARVLSAGATCLIRVSYGWCNIPSSLVMPLLFLYRRVKQRKSAK